MPSTSRIVVAQRGWVAGLETTARLTLGAGEGFAAAASRVTPEPVSVNSGRALRSALTGHNGNVSDPARPERALATWPCQSICVWERIGEVQVPDDGPQPAVVFECRGCGSEWLRSEGWTPVDADGLVPVAVAAEATRRPA
jgi:hypothetical protein